MVGAILVGALLSFWLGANVTIPGGHVPIAVASGLAFGFSELCDLGVYEPLREHSLASAVGLSQIAGAVADSVIFLILAFGSLSLIWGQVWAKSVIVLPFVALLLIIKPRLVRAA